MLGRQCYNVPKKINNGYWTTVGWPQRIEAVYDKVLKKLEANKVRLVSATSRHAHVDNFLHMRVNKVQSETQTRELCFFPGRWFL